VEQHYLKTSYFNSDWSEEGKLEREMCYKPLTDELIKKYPDEKERGSIKVVCPGSGLGRLPFEVASLGFRSQGNEFSYYMLIGSNFVLNW
jgi:carnosine N-methyltransferase